MSKDKNSVCTNQVRWKNSRYITFEFDAKEHLLAAVYNLKENIE